MAGSKVISRMASCWYGWLVITTLLFTASGATCARRRTMAEFAPPIVFQSTPTLEELMTHVNHSRSIQRLESPLVTISSPDISIKLQGNLAWQSPSNFRLQAYPGTRLMGNVLDAGSNAEVFWLQAQIPPSPTTLYYARHDEFEAQYTPRTILPVSPLWLKEAIGVIELDPNHHHDQPIVRADGRLEIRSLIPSPRGQYQRIIILNAANGVIEETLLKDPTDRLVAAAYQSRHEFSSEINFSLPRRVQIQLIGEDGYKMQFTIEVDFYRINQTSGDDSQKFAMPADGSVSRVDIGKAIAGSAPVSIPPAYTPEPQGSYTSQIGSGTIFR